MTTADPIRLLNTPDGHRLAREVLRKHLPYDPHDYQIEGVCQAFDGVHFVGILPTGAGKTGYFVQLLVLLRELRTDSRIHEDVRARLPDRPGMIIICPTNALEAQMVRDTVISLVKCH
jgi:superfamily II DNA or RNA helicase